MFPDADVRPTPPRVPVRRRRAVVAAGGVLLLSGLAAGPAVAADAPRPVALGAQAWFQRDPSCATPLGCSPTAPPSSNPFGAGTLHVAVTGGQESARSYLALTGLPAGATVTGGTLTVPLDTMTPGNGSTAPETSKVQVCTTIATVTAVEGSFDRPPQEDCSSHASAAYVATPAPHLQADLAPLAGALSAPSVALVLLPDGSVAASDFWHVVFSATSRATPPTPPASVTLTLAGGTPGAVTPVMAATEPPSSSSPSPTATPSPTARPATQPRPAKVPSAVATTAHVAPPVAGIPVAPPPVDGSVVAAGAPPLPVAAPSLPVAAPVVPQPLAAQTPPAAPAAAGVPAAAEAPQQPAPAQAAPVAFTTGYAYPIIWLLPILFVAAVVAVGRMMTRDLTPARPSR